MAVDVASRKGLHSVLLWPGNLAVDVNVDVGR